MTERARLNLFRWIATLIVGGGVSFLYSTGFFYTHPIAIFSGFLACLGAMLFVPFFSGVSGKMSYPLAAVSLGLALALFAAMSVVQGFFLTFDAVVAALTSAQGLTLAAPVIGVLFAGALVSGLLTPARQNKQSA